jgi:hypothetical protein
LNAKKKKCKNLGQQMAKVVTYITHPLRPRPVAGSYEHGNEPWVL